MADDRPTISISDRDVLRRLAARVAAHAAAPVQAERRREWTRHNALDAGRPMVFASPEGAWGEILTGADLECVGEEARGWEWGLRAELVWAEYLRDDRVIEGVVNVGPIVSDDGWGVDVPHQYGEGRGSYVWEAPIVDYDRDLPKVHIPNRTYHRAATEERLAAARSLFGDILDVRLKADWGWFVPLTWGVVRLRGLERIMLDMYDEPDYLKRLIGLVQSAGHALLDWAVEHDLLCLNNDGSYVASGGFGWSRELPSPGYTGTARPIDLWGFAESQETVGVSARLFEEFILPHQIGWCERFGLNCYGCCEPIDQRWDGVKRIPRLRRVSVSPWSNVERTAANLGPNYVFSWKPNPADLAMEAFHEDQVRASVRRTLEVCKANDCRLEMIMKDTHTVRGEPDRICRWVAICREEIARAYSLG